MTPGLTWAELLAGRRVQRIMDNPTLGILLALALFLGTLLAIRGGTVSDPDVSFDECVDTCGPRGLNAWSTWECDCVDSRRT